MTNRLHSTLHQFAALSLAIFLLVSCGKGEKAESPAPPPADDAVQALMLTYETVIMPEQKSIRFQVASDGAFVRLGNETENWRLFDTKNETITFVDQTSGIATEVTFQDALAERTRMLAAAPVEGAPSASIVEGPGEPERGHPTHRVHIKVGTYSREIVLSTDRLLPDEFFAMKIATDPLDSRYASIMKDVMPVLVRQTGTLLSETNQLTFEEGEPITATTTLVSVTTIQLSRKAFSVPDNISVTKENATATETAPPADK